MDAARFINHPSGFLACAPANLRYQLSGLEGFVSFRVQGKYRIAFGGVHSPLAEREPLLRAFLDATRQAGQRPLFVQVPRHQVNLFAGEGAVVNRLGSSFALALKGYSLRGTAKISLRNKIHRAKRAGLIAVELGRDSPKTPVPAAQIDRISALWLRDKGKKELAFMVGATRDALDSYRRTFVALDAQGNVVAFITYVPAWGEKPGYLHDLSRRHPDAPPGTMELINAFAIARFQTEDVANLHFGFTPFVMTGEEPVGASGLMSRLSAFLYSHGRLIYPAKSQADYKRKWGADQVEPEYLAGFPISLSAVFALLRLTRAL